MNIDEMKMLIGELVLTNAALAKRLADAEKKIAALVGKNEPEEGDAR